MTRQHPLMEMKTLKTSECKQIILIYQRLSLNQSFSSNRPSNGRPIKRQEIDCFYNAVNEFVFLFGPDNRINEQHQLAGTDVLLRNTIKCHQICIITNVNSMQNWKKSVKMSHNGMVTLRLKQRAEYRQRLMISITWGQLILHLDILYRPKMHNILFLLYNAA